MLQDKLTLNFGALETELTDHDAEGEMDGDNCDVVLSDSELTDRDADGETDDGTYEAVWSPRSVSNFNHTTTVAASPDSAADDVWTDEDAEGEPDDGNYEIVVPVGDGSYLFVPSGCGDAITGSVCAAAYGCLDKTSCDSGDDCGSEYESFVSESEAYDGGDEMDTEDEDGSSVIDHSLSPCPSIRQTPKMVTVYLPLFRPNGRFSA